MGLRFTSGSIFQGLAMIGGGILALHEGVPWVGWFLIVIGVFSLFFDVHIEGGRIRMGGFWSFKRRVMTMWPQYLMLFCLLGFLMGLVAFLVRGAHPMSAGDCFSDASASRSLKSQHIAITEALNTDNYLERLGASESGCFRVVERAAIGQYQRGIAIWIPKPRGWFGLSNEVVGWEWHEEKDDLNAPWAEITNPAGRLERFKMHGTPPAGLHPPYAGMAIFLDRSPKEWAKYGWQYWTMQMPISLYQPFKNGHVLGVYPSRPDARAGKVFILWNDDKSVTILPTKTLGAEIDPDHDLERFK